MALTLFLLALATSASLTITYLAALDVVAGNHILWAVGSVCLALFTLSIHLFYFIGTGSDVKALLADKNIDQESRRRIVAETRVLKKRTFPGLTVSMLLLMITFVMGGAVGVGLVSPVIHQIVATVALVACTTALTVAQLMVRRNYDLLVQVGSMLRE